MFPNANAAASGDLETVVGGLVAGCLFVFMFVLHCLSRQSYHAAHARAPLPRAGELGMILVVVGVVSYAHMVPW